MTTTVVKTIGSGGDYTTLQSWEDASPSNYTTTRANTTQAGSTSSTIVLDAAASAVNNFYNGHAVWCDARPSEKRLITAYDGTTKVATIGVLNGSSATWANTPGTEAFTIDSTIWQGQIKAASDAFSSASNLLTISGGAVDASNYAQLTTAAAASWRDNVNVQTNAWRWNSANGCSILCTGSYVSAITVNQDFSRFSNLQVANTGTGGSAAGTINSTVVSGTATMDVNNCILETATGPVYFLYGANQKIRNSLAIQRGSGKPQIAKTQNGAMAHNCTLVVPSDKTAATDANVGYSAAPMFSNCAFFGCTNVSSGGTAPSFTTCYTSDATPPSGCTNAAYTTAQFVNITDATRDFRLLTGSALVDTGTADPTDAPIDAAGTPRPQGAAYDVGGWELVVAAGGGFMRIVGDRFSLAGRGGLAA